MNFASGPSSSLAFSGSSETLTYADTPAPSANEQDVSRRESIEKTLWENEKLTDCDHMLSEDWQYYSTQNTPESRKQFRHTAALQANLRMDFGAYNQALECYQIILKQDEFYLPDTNAVASDYNNIGLCYALQASASVSPEKRLDSYTKAIQSLKLAEARYRKVNNEAGLIECLANQYTVLNDMHKHSDAVKIFAQISHLDKSFDTSFRRLLLTQS